MPREVTAQLEVPHLFINGEALWSSLTVLFLSRGATTSKGNDFFVVVQKQKKKKNPLISGSLKKAIQVPY